jgi:hypothetical protein
MLSPIDLKNGLIMIKAVRLMKLDVLQGIRQLADDAVSR